MRTVKDNIQFVDSAFHPTTYVLNIVSETGHFLTHHAWSSDFVEPPSDFPLVLVSQISARHLRYPIFLSTFSGISLRKNKPKEVAYQGNQLTYFLLFDLLGQDSKDVKHVNHDIHYNIGHFFRRREFDIYLESGEEPFDTFK
jgi:hypothetical protein